MIRSMTGFARIERQFEFGRLSWEMRSVNHRFLDVRVRLPHRVQEAGPAVEKIARTIRLAVDDAGLAPEEIGAVSSAASGCRRGDRQDLQRVHSGGRLHDGRRAADRAGERPRR